MAKRSPRQELRATPSQAPYRRAKPAASPPRLDLPMPPPASLEAPAALEAPASPASPLAPPGPPPPVPALVTADLPELLAVATSALGFAAAALASLPAPTDLIQREPSAAEPPPGKAPPGDARSLRSDTQFVLIYRHGATLVSRRGKLGEHGVWRTVTYPGPAQAAHAYALECSRLIEQGFRDVA